MMEPLLQTFIIAMVSVILVPQGAEYQAVRQGLKSQVNPPQAIPIPAGKAAGQQLDRISDATEVLVMGLCGSLSPRLGTGAIALYQSSMDNSGTVKECDRALTQRLQEQLQVSPVRGFTSDRVIHLLSNKRELGKTYGAEVVDMESFAILSQIRVAILRVVSDGLEGDLPDLSDGFDADGNLKAMLIAKSMIKAPIAAGRLIRGSLTSLKKLRQLAATLSFLEEL